MTTIDNQFRLIFSISQMWWSSQFLFSEDIAGSQIDNINPYHAEFVLGTQNEFTLYVKCGMSLMRVLQNMTWTYAE